MLKRLFLACILLSSFALADDDGHSKHGTAFDSGMRTKPWKMEGIGDTPFPITSKNKEVQQWFNQGIELLQSFWFEEAERSFRWCLKLDPECAMAYWGLARCGYNWFAARGTVGNDPNDRYRAFLNEAVKRKDAVSERERLYIEAWDQAFTPGVGDINAVLRPALEKIVIKFPDDVEAKVLLAFHSINAAPGAAYQNQLLINEILRKHPLHPGAHHASIHNWDYIDPTQALLSCAMYGKSAPMIGHALHMPGHCYSKMGMWHEAARSMDAATRTELRYMNQRLALPYETWNYPHNRNYLCYIQEQLGMAEASIQGARDMLTAPTDPGADNTAGGGYQEGLVALVRACLKFERWDDMLRPGFIPWNPSDEGQFTRRFAETIAYTGKGQLKEARESYRGLNALYQKLVARDKNSEGWLSPRTNLAEGLLLLAEGNTMDGQQRLLDVNAKQNYMGDPPDAPWPASRLLGDFYLRHGDAKLAIEAYHRALDREHNDAFSFAGLAQAYVAAGDRENAKKCAGKLLYVWSNADPGLRWMKEVEALNLDAKPIADVPGPERPYRPAELASYGPSNWAPFAAPKLECIDKNGKSVTLDQYRGKNVLLVFYLDASCAHCVEQLSTIDGRKADFEKQNTVVLAVSSTSPEKNAKTPKLEEFSIQLLSDANHENARRYASYDDFEEISLHSTILIDTEGKVRWKRTGGDPFTNVDFLLRELGHINQPTAKPAGG